jgi:predicted metalloendopeptidase
VLDDLHLMGARTQGENIADLGGVRIAFRAFHQAGRAGALPVEDGFSPDQRFFLSYASVWCVNIRPEELRKRVLSDAHSPPQFRVNGPLSNLEEFAAAFRVPAGAPMSRPPGARVQIW